MDNTIDYAMIIFYFWDYINFVLFLIFFANGDSIIKKLNPS